MSFTVELLTPVSANSLFANVPGRGRIKTKAYENWQNTAALEIVAAVRADRRVGGPVDVRIELPTACRLDIDNAVKPILDALVRSQRIDDDQNVWHVEVFKNAREGDKALVMVQRWPAEQSAAARDDARHFRAQIPTSTDPDYLERMASAAEATRSA